MRVFGLVARVILHQSLMSTRLSAPVSDGPIGSPLAPIRLGCHGQDRDGAMASPMDKRTSGRLEELGCQVDRDRDRPVTADATITSTAATTMAMTHRTQSIHHAGSGGWP